MIWFILAFVIAVIVGIAFGKEEGSEAGIGAALITLLFASMFAVLPNLFCSGLGKTYDSSYAVNLVNIRDGEQISGHFYLRSGTITSGPAYFYYVAQNGGFQQFQADASKALVKEYDGTPKVEYHYNKKVHANRWLSVFPSLDENPDWDHIVFYVPTGSIVQDYTLGQ